jgi:hypothetical protein
MSDLFHETTEQLESTLRSGDLEECERVVVERIRKLPRSPFDLSIDVNISNDPADAARSFDRFLDLETKRVKIAAAYAEMNGFYINPGLWFCDFFAYASYGGHDDYDWLSQWQSGEFPRYPIRGMETLQAVYASARHGKKSDSEAEDMSSLLVVIRFQLFMKKAATHMKSLCFPLLITAHDFDFIAEVGPNV